jgi:hypothetical protein
MSEKVDLAASEIQLGALPGLNRNIRSSGQTAPARAFKVVGDLN